MIGEIVTYRLHENSFFLEGKYLLSSLLQQYNHKSESNRLIINIMDHYIDTPRLRLIPCDRAIFENIFSGDKALGNYLNVKVPHKWNEFGGMPFRFAFERVIKNPDEKSWWTYLAVQVDLKYLLGSCGYKGKPDFTGCVEIGYQVAEKFRNQGYAYEMAKALIKHAFSHDTVKKIIAHTLPEENASVKVLRRCGLEFAGEHMDPEDGKVWRWEINKS